MSPGAERGAATFWRRWQRHGWALLAVVFLVVLVWGPGARHVRAASLLLRFEGVREGIGGWVADLARHPVEQARLDLGTGEGRVRARRYRPVDVDDPPGLVLVHGVHFRGMDEPRLVRFARSLASAGLDVLTPQVPSLAELRIEPSAIDVIGRSASAFAEERGGGRVGVVGISFAGGLALQAAADPERGEAIAYVVAVGAHHDLARVAQWYAGGLATGPDGEPATAAPHSYGAGVLVYEHVEAFFPPEDVPEAREAMRLLLHERWKEARAMLPELTEPGQSQLRRVLGKKDRGPLRQRLRQVIAESEAEMRAVSPAGKIGHLDRPVLLVHGEGDPVVPSTETLWLARELPEVRLRQVVITDALRHAERNGEGPSLGEQWELVHFIAELLALAE